MNVIIKSYYEKHHHMGGNTMKNVCKLLCLLFACVMCISCFAGCKKDAGAEDDTSSTSSQDTQFTLDGCRIVYGDGNEYGNEAGKAMDLQKQIKSRYGAELDIGSDYLERDAEYDSESKEILVGHTDYPQSQKVADKVTRLDYLITKDGNKIVLMAGSPEALAQCVEYFLNNYISDDLTLTTTDEHLERYSYAFEETALRVVSLNLRYAKSATQNNQSVRAPRIYNFIKNALPSSFGVQECEKFWRDSLVATIGELGYVPAQEEAYSASGDYAFKNFIWYNSNTTELKTSGRIWLSETPNTPSKGFGSDFYISAAWALLADKQTGAEYIHVNTHLTAEKNDTLREKEIAVLLAKIKTFTDKGYMVVITGDFNSNTMTDVYSTMSDSFLDARDTAKETTKLGTYNKYSQEGVTLDQSTYTCIDYCFYTETPNIYVSKFNVIDRYSGGYMSDHNALITDFILYKR